MLNEIAATDIFILIFFFNDTATTEIYTLSLHDALPILVASPPSSSTMFGVQPPVGPLAGPRRVCSMHHSYSSSVSPFQAKTGTPRAAIAAAAWSWVEKMLQEAQRTSAPSSSSVSMSTAVWIVMCREPVMRAPASGLLA